MRTRVCALREGILVLGLEVPVREVGRVNQGSVTPWESRRHVQPGGATGSKVGEIVEGTRS